MWHSGEGRGRSAELGRTQGSESFFDCKSFVSEFKSVCDIVEQTFEAIAAAAMSMSTVGSVSLRFAMQEVIIFMRFVIVGSRSVVGEQRGEAS
jgi:hypothetical protein